MKKSKTMICFLLVCCLLLGLLTACGSSESGTTQENAPASEEVSNAESSPAQSTETQTQPSAEAETAGESPEAETEQDTEAQTLSEPEPFVLPIVDEPTTLTLWMRTEPFTLAYPEIDINNVTFYKEMEDRTGIHLDIQGVVAFQADEQFNLMMVSDEYTDMIARFKTFYSAGVDAGIDNEIIIDLAELMDEYMPNYQYVLANNDTFRRDSTSADGHIGAANTLNYKTEGEQIGPVIRQDWLDELGMAAPVTYDEYYEVLKAFQANGHEGALALRWNGINSGSYLLAGFGAAGFYDDTAVAVPFLNIAGTVEFGPIMEGYKDYLILMNQWYAEGLIYSDFMSLDTSTYPQNLSNGTFGIAVVDRGQFTSTQLALESIDPDANLVGCKDARQNAEDVLHIQYIDHSVSDGYSITTSCDIPEIAAQYLDYLYTEEGSILAGYGVEGEGLTYDADGNPQMSELILHNETYPCTPAMVLYSSYGAPGVYDGSRYMGAYDQRTQEAVAIWDEDDQDWLYPYNASLTLEESETYAPILNDIYTYVSEMTLKFITGAEDPEAGWDDYVATIEAMGVDTIIEIKQTALERYLEN